MAKLREQSYTLRFIAFIVKKILAFRAIKFFSDAEDCSLREVAVITVYTVLFIISIGIYCYKVKELAAIMLLVYITVVIVATAHSRISCLIASCVFAIPMWLCILTLGAPEDHKLLKCKRIEASMQDQDQDNSYLKYWHKHNCGGN